MKTGGFNSLKKGIFGYSIFALILLALFNLYIYKDNQEDYSKIVNTTANALLTALEARVEIHLVGANNIEAQAILADTTLADEILFVEIRDNQESLVASKSQDGFNSQILNQYQYIEKQITNEININEFEEFFGEDNAQVEVQTLGFIKVYLKPYSAMENYRNAYLTYFFNLILFVVFVIAAIIFLKKLSVRNNQISQISNFLASNKIDYIETNTSSEINDLYTNAAHVVDKLSKQNIQLVNLKQEIQYAREDSNMELHKFLAFLINSNKVELDQKLTIFSESVLRDQSNEKSLVDIGRSISSAIAKHSELSTENNVVIYDNILNKLEDYRVFLDDELFAQFLDLFVEQMIMLCKNSELNINADINQLQDDSNILRLSFESSSPSFSKALEMQSLFEFTSTALSSVSENNAAFIACKHLAQKSGGDYIFLQDEVRFEFPVLIEKNYVATSNLSLIEPLEEQRSVLVYDSDPTERIVLMGYLDKFGQHSDKATTKQVVLQKLRQNHYDILCVNSDFFSDQDPYFLTNFKSEYLSLESQPMLLVISSNSKIIKNDYFKSFNAKLLRKPIDLKVLQSLLIKLS